MLVLDKKRNEKMCQWEKNMEDGVVIVWKILFAVC